MDSHIDDRIESPLLLRNDLMPNTLTLILESNEKLFWGMMGFCDAFVYIERN